MRYILLPFLLLTVNGLAGQTTYKAAIEKHMADYVAKHEVVKADDKKYLHFYPVNEAYRVTASFKPIENGAWFKMESSGKFKTLYRVYGVTVFKLNGKEHQLNIYQSQSLMSVEAYKNYLFLPFADATNGEERYEGGRYIDIRTEDIVEGKLVIDFNKAYNPYCAYVSGVYSCPLPPRENNLPVPVAAGEKAFAKAH